MSDALIKDLSGYVQDYLSNGLFTSKEDSIKHIMDLCKQLLLYNGYKIIDPNVIKHNVTKLDELIEMFYALKDKYFPEQITTNYRSDIRLDRKYAKQFVESRQRNKTISRKVAIDECVSIILSFFKYKDMFKFENIGFYIFGLDKFQWVVESIISKMNKETSIIKEDKLKELVNEAEDYFEKHERDKYYTFNLDELIGE